MHLEIADVLRVGAPTDGRRRMEHPTEDGHRPEPLRIRGTIVTGPDGFLWPAPGYGARLGLFPTAPSFG